MKTYYVKYRRTESSLEEGICILARSKYEAYDKAVYEAIPEREGTLPYSAWVQSVTYNNGNYHEFNTCEGLPY